MLQQFYTYHAIMLTTAEFWVVYKTFLNTSLNVHNHLEVNNNKTAIY